MIQINAEMGKECCGGSDSESTAPVVENVSEAEVKDVLARIKQNPAQAQSLIQSIDIEGDTFLISLILY